MGKPAGLVKRKGSAAWYFRQRCPKHLKMSGSPADIWISLETANYTTALTRLEDARQEAHRRFTAMPSPTGIHSRSLPPSWPKDDDLPMLTSEQAAPLARAFFADAVRELDCAPPPPADVDEAAKRAWCTELENMLARLTAPEPNDGIDDVAGARFAVLRKAKRRAEPGSEPLHLLHNYLRQAMAQSCKIELARLHGDFSDRISDRLFANCLTVGLVERSAPVPHEAGQDVPVGVIARSLGDVVESYLAEVLAKSTTDKTKDRYRAELKHIVAFFGKDKPVWQINGEECRRFRAAFTLLPPNFEDKIRGGKDIAAIVAERHDTDKVLAWATPRQIPRAAYTVHAMGAQG